MSESTNWTQVMHDELGFLQSVGAINLSSEEIIVISNLGCCGIYKNGVFSVPRSNCSEILSVPFVNTSLTWIAVILSFLPGILIAVYLVKNKFKNYLAFLFGGLGWLIALIIRTLFLSLIQELNFITLLISVNLLSSIFEEGIRFLLLKHSKIARKNPIITGLGWGVFEAFMIYALNVTILLLMNQAISFSNALPGAVEKIMTIALHSALTIIVLKSLKNKKYLFISIFLHFFVNIISSIAFTIFGLNVWIVELIIFLSTSIIICLAYKIIKHEKRNTKKIKRRK